MDEPVVGSDDFKSVCRILRAGNRNVIPLVRTTRANDMLDEQPDFAADGRLLDYRDRNTGIDKCAESEVRPQIILLVCGVREEHRSRDGAVETQSETPTLTMVPVTSSRT